MLKKKTIGAILAVTVMFAITAQIVSPQQLDADDNVPIVTYSAGFQIGPTCQCPVDPGNCACVFVQ